MATSKHTKTKATPEAGGSLTDMGMNAQEAEFDLAVFERLRKLLDVVVKGNTLHPATDDYIKPNYDVRDNGLWLKEQSGDVDALNWTPACAQQSLPKAPDPLLALPQPFKAQHLAAFFLGGWGYFLGCRCVWDDLFVLIPNGPDLALLNGVQDARARLALNLTWQALADARAKISNGDDELGRALREADAAYSRALDAIGREDALYNENMAVAHAAFNALERKWRTAMVQHLLPAQNAIVEADLQHEPRQTAMQRQEARYRACVDAKLSMPISPVGRLPTGIGDVAKRLGISRQSLTSDVRAHIDYLNQHSKGS